MTQDQPHQRAKKRSRRRSKKRGRQEAQEVQEPQAPQEPQKLLGSKESQRHQSNKKRPRRRKSSSEERIRRAIALLDEVAREEAQHLGLLRLSPLHLSLFIGESERPSQAPEDDLITLQANKVIQQIKRQTQALVPTQFQRGTVYCFQSNSGIAPPTIDSVFWGYDPLGRPLWTRMLPLFMNAQLPHLEQIYATPPQPLAYLMSAPVGTLPIPNVTQGRIYEVLAQVVIGPLASHFGVIRDTDERHTLTAQMILAQPPEHPLQINFNLIGLNPDDLFDAAAKSAPRAPIARARDCISAARRSTRHLQGQLTQGRVHRDTLIQESETILSRLSAALLRVLSREPQRTRHAQQRHQSMERPTSEAWRDAARAGDERLMWDEHQETIVVIGPKSRAHIFSEAGQHVTSLRLGVGEVERKINQRRWGPLSVERTHRFRSLIRARS